MPQDVEAVQPPRNMMKKKATAKKLPVGIIHGQIDNGRNEHANPDNHQEQADNQKNDTGINADTHSGGGHSCRKMFFIAHMTDGHNRLFWIYSDCMMR